MTRRLKHVAIFLLFFAFLSCETAGNFTPPPYFVKYYEGEGNQFGVDFVVDDTDGSIYLLGSTSFGTTDAAIYLIKVNADGMIQWEEKLGDPKDFYEAKDIELTSDGRLAILANKGSSGNRDFTIWLLAPEDHAQPANILIRNYGNVGFDDDANTITEVSDGFIVSGTTTRLTPGASDTDRRDGFFYRFTSSLQDYSATWEPHYNQGDNDVIVKTFEAVPGSLFHVFGYTDAFDGDSNNDYNLWIFSITQAGGVASNNFVIENAVVAANPAKSAYQGILRNERVTSVAYVPLEDRYVVAGYSTPPSIGIGRQDLFVTTIRKSFDLVPPTNKPGIFHELPTIITVGLSPISDVRASIFPSRNSGYVVLSSENNGNGNLMLSRLSSELTNAWTAEGLLFGGEGNDLPGSVGETAAGDILIMGTMVVGNVDSQRKMVLMKVNPAGKF